MEVCQSKRLVIRHLSESDHEFIYRLLNEDSFIRYVFDKKIKNKNDAVKYLVNGPISSYKINGFGLNAVVLKDTGVPIGMCGLIKRESLEYPDLGYALLPEYWGSGYAKEAAKAVMQDGCNKHKIKRVVAITDPTNIKSIILLEKLGFKFKSVITLNGFVDNLYEYITCEWIR